MIQTFRVTGMSCGHCVKAVTAALRSIPGVAEVEVDLAGGRVRVDGAVDAATLIDAIASAGYQADQAPSP